MKASRAAGKILRIGLRQPKRVWRHDSTFIVEAKRARMAEMATRFQNIFSQKPHSALAARGPSVYKGRRGRQIEAGSKSGSSIGVRSGPIFGGADRDGEPRARSISSAIENGAGNHSSGDALLDFRR